MSQIALQSNVGGTGIFTIASPNSNTNRTLTIPDETGTFITSSSIAASLNATGSAPLYACRAWVNFNGAGTVAIRAAGNVTSITDNGVGSYTINFTTALEDTNYSGVVTSNTGGGSSFAGVLTFTTGSLLVNNTFPNTGPTDAGVMCAAIFR